MSDEKDDDDKFKVIGEVKIGALEGTMRQAWDRLYAEQLRLMKENETHEAAMDAFWDGLLKKFGPEAVVHEDEPRFRISPEGEVFQEFCKCPVCQAGVHGLTVAETVEEMYKNDLIPHHFIDHIRQRAKMVDSQREMSKKLMN